VFAVLTFGLVGAGFYFDHVEQPASASDVNALPASHGDTIQLQKNLHVVEERLSKKIDDNHHHPVEAVSPADFAKAMAEQRKAAEVRLEEAMAAQRKAEAERLQVISKQTALLYETMTQNAAEARTRAKAAAERDATRDANLRKFIGETAGQLKQEVEVTRDTAGEVHQNQRIEALEKAQRELRNDADADNGADEDAAADADAADEQ
jgi:hypothetical protein